MSKRDTFMWRPMLVCEKYDPDATQWVARKSGLLQPSGDVFTAYGVKPYETIGVEGNLLLTNGLNNLTGVLVGATAPNYVLANNATRIGVGNSSTAEAVGQTDLQGASKYFKVMDSTYPSRSNGVITAKSTFASGDAEFTWAEWGIDVDETTPVTSGATVNNTLINRKVAALGAKGAGSTWALTVTITFS